MIQFDRVSKRYPGGHQALKAVSFTLQSGEMAFLTGHSGAGKSTLLRLIALIERTNQGRVLIDGHNLADIKKRQVPFLRRQIGMIFQNHSLLTDRNVFDNVAFPLLIRGYNERDMGRRVRAALDKVGLLNKERAQPMTLSSGEQQRVGIARAVVAKPAILLADEPTGNLDPELSQEIMHLFEQFNQVGVTTLIASHDLALIESMGRRVLTLNQGALVAA